jgi:hypothetical protein
MSMRTKMRTKKRGNLPQNSYYHGFDKKGLLFQQEEDNHGKEE